MIPHPPADELMAFRDGELTSPRREDVAVHVAACDACRATIEGFANVSARLQQWPVEATPVSLQRPVATAPAKSTRPLYYWAAAAAVLLVICVIASPRNEKTTTAVSPPAPASGASRSARNRAVPVSFSTWPSAVPPAKSQASAEPVELTKSSRPPIRASRLATSRTRCCSPTTSAWSALTARP